MKLPSFFRRYRPALFSVPLVVGATLLKS